MNLNNWWHLLSFTSSKKSKNKKYKTLKSWNNGYKQNSGIKLKRLLKNISLNITFS